MARVPNCVDCCASVQNYKYLSTYRGTKFVCVVCRYLGVAVGKLHLNTFHANQIGGFVQFTLLCLILDKITSLVLYFV